MHSGKGPNDLGSEPSCRAAENSKYFTIYTTGKRHNTYLGLCLPDVCTEEEVKYGIRNFMV